MCMEAWSSHGCAGGLECHGCAWSLGVVMDVHGGLKQ